MKPASISLTMPRDTAERLLQTTAGGAPAHLIGVIQISEPDPIDLSAEDREILRLLADDQSIRHIAKTLGRAESTIHLRLRDLKVKLKCRGLAGLVATALRKRILD